MPEGLGSPRLHAERGREIGDGLVFLAEAFQRQRAIDIGPGMPRAELQGNHGQHHYFDSAADDHHRRNGAGFGYS